MTIHTIIENLSAYEAVRRKDPHGNRLWWTTSPYLLAHLPTRGEAVRSPEESLSLDIFNKLGFACRDTIDEFCKWLDKQCDWKDYVQFEIVFPYSLFRSLFTLLYKGILIDLVQQYAGENPVVCVGDDRLPSSQNMAFAHGRFENLFAIIAGQCSSSAISIEKHIVSLEVQKQLDREVLMRKMGRFEKALSLMNNTPASFIFKMWKRFQEKQMWPFKSICLRPGPKKTFFLHKPCELIEEAFFGMLFRGARLKLLGRLPAVNVTDTDADQLPDRDLISNTFTEKAKNQLQSKGIPWNGFFDTCMEMSANRILANLAAIRSNLDRFSQIFEKTTAGFGDHDEIITQSFTALVDKVFYCFCRKKGITVNAFDHGITHGLSEWSHAYAHQASILASDRAFFHCKRGVKAVSHHAQYQTAYAVGLPKVTSNVSFRPVQRFLSRYWLGIEKKEKVIMYVADLDRNNYIYGPYNDNDFSYFKKTRSIVSTLCRSFPSSTIILKLYPTLRYIDHYSFSDLCEKYNNLRIIKDIDFRFIRTVPDLIMVSSTQSTLGWVAGSGVPYLYLDFDWSPGRIKGLSMNFPEIDGLKTAIIPDQGEVCDGDSRSVGSLLMESVLQTTTRKMINANNDNVKNA